MTANSAKVMHGSGAVADGSGGRVVNNGELLYGRRYGVFRNPAPAAEIARLDPVRDCERIVQLMGAYEFPWDIERAMELALIHTYGSASVARLLNHTGQFRKQGQKRFDDTRLLVIHFMGGGLDGELGQRAITRMNEIHGKFRISNEDFLFVLWTNIDFPIQWSRRYAWRPFTEHECLAWFTFWRQVGLKMGIQDLPETREALDAFAHDYEARQMVFNRDSRQWQTIPWK